MEQSCICSLNFDRRNKEENNVETIEKADDNTIQKRKEMSDSSLSNYPETVQFTGVVFSSLKQVHISAFLIALVGVLVTIQNPFVGLPLLFAFLLLILGVEAWMIRKSRKQIRITLYLRENPVQALQGMERIGEISSGSIDPDMDEPNELGFRPAPKRSLIVWKFDSKEDKEIAAKRLLEYLPRDTDI